MRRPLLPLFLLLTTVLVSGGCGGDDMANEVLVVVEFDGTTCRITEADPGFVATGDDIDVLAAAPDAEMALVVTNTSDVDVTGLVNRYDPSLSPEEALAMERGLVESGWTIRNEPPGFMVGPAFTDFSAESLDTDENQLQYHYVLAPGVNKVLVYSQYDAWYCETSPPMFSVVEVHGDATAAG